MTENELRDYANKRHELWGNREDEDHEAEPETNPRRMVISLAVIQGFLLGVIITVAVMTKGTTW